ncbi:uncharacterized protein [Misgurnus anguillicaudatus]|uniref:uncharacterized protein isoform X2 n=1 Tax=Misgurnus anguillicaudatus TaxID=75329 RepID=UPI0024350A83|nr:uncharacterized protein LOC129453710 isoform X2 [Misgurnus anguillicaudatus]
MRCQMKANDCVKKKILRCYTSMTKYGNQMTTDQKATESGSSDRGERVNPEQVNTAADRHGLSSFGPSSPSSGLQKTAGASQGSLEWAGEAARFPRRLPAPRQRGGREINTEKRCCQGSPNAASSHGAMGACVLCFLSLNQISVNSHQLKIGPRAMTFFMRKRESVCGSARGPFQAQHHLIKHRLLENK